MRLYFIPTILALIFLPMQAAELLKGDADAADGETFSFRIQNHLQTHVSNLQGLHVYVSAHPDEGGASKEFAVSRVARADKQFLPLTPEKVRFNGQKNEEGSFVENPLYNKGISFLSLFVNETSALQGNPERPVVVLSNDLKTIYLINSFNSRGENVEVLSIHNFSLSSDQNQTQQNIPDAAGAVTSGIVGLQSFGPYIFAATKPNAGGNFGDADSGIALAQVATIEVQKKPVFTGPMVTDAPTFSLARSGGNRAASLDVSSDFLKINSDLAFMGQVVDMTWHPQTDRLYVALQITSTGVDAADGGRALAMGRFTTVLATETNEETGTETKSLQKTGFILEEIVSASVFDGAQDKIVGAIGAGTEVSLHKVRSMYTSTALPYLIVQGDVGSVSTTKRSVFALPLVLGNSAASKNGTIANKDTAPKKFFSVGTSVPMFMTRGITEPATTSDQMTLATDSAARVGGGDLVNGDITDMFVFQDTVFATVGTPDGNQTPGIFFSHAYFDEEGKIAGWTAWRHEAGTLNQVAGINFDNITANKTFLVENSSDEVKIVKRTEWSDGDGMLPVHAAINSFLPREIGGVQGLYDFVATSTTYDIETPGLQDVSLLVATGLNKVMLFETSRVESGIEIPNLRADFGALTEFNNGTITQTFPITGSKMLGISGGALDQIGPITAAEIARDGAMGLNGYLFVGGVRGAAVLSQGDGSGWDATTELGIGLAGLFAGMNFKPLKEEYSFVRKLINDGRYLYILTDKKLDRINLIQDAPGLGEINPITIAQAGEQNTFLDCIISEKFALIATNQGLMRLGNGQSIQTVGAGAVWQIVPTPEGAGPVRQLVAISYSGRAQDVSKNNGGMIYALSAYRGKDLAQIFRYRVMQTESAEITDTTIQKVDDIFVKDIPSFFASFGLFRNIFATDGALFFGTRSKHNEEDPVVTVLTSNSIASVQTTFASRPLFNREVPVGLANSTVLAAMLKNSSSGSWLVAGDNGIRINE